MSDEKPRFTSDLRAPSRASWASEEDWAVGSPSNVDVVDGELVPQRGSGSVGVADGGVLLEGFERDVPLAIYQGDRGDFTGSSGAVFGGSKSLYSLGGPSTGVNVITTDGLDRLPSRGDRFSYRLMDDGSMRQRFIFGTQDVGNPRDDAYEVLVDSVGGGLQIAKYKNGSSVFADEVSVGLPGDGWLEPEIRWFSNGVIAVFLYDALGAELAMVSIDDGEWDSGGIGWGEHQSVANWWADELTLWEMGL